MDSEAFLAAVQTGNVAEVRQFIAKKPRNWQKIVDKNGSGAMAYAILYKHLELVTYFIKAGVNIENRVTGSGSTAFLYAANKGYVQAVDLFLKKKCNIQAKNDLGNGALALACFGGHIEIVKKLVSLGLPVSEINQNGYTTLHAAAYGGNIEVVLLLISQGAHMEARTTDGMTPFLIAVMRGNIEVAACLMSHNCDVFAKKNNGMGALSFASENGDLKLLKALVVMGLDIDEEDKAGRTALHRAIQYGNLKVVQFLIAKGANFQAPDKGGNTPILLCAMTDNVCIMDALVSIGCDVQAKNKWGQGILMLISLNNHVKMARQFVEFGFCVNEKDDSGVTPLHGAARYGRAEMADFLIESGADVDAQNNQGKTPLHLAVCHGETGVVAVLYNSGCNIHAFDHEGRNPVMVACIAEHLDTAKWLLSKFKYQDISRLFHLAAQIDCAKLVVLLISFGADCETLDQWGCTPLLTAIEFGCDNVIDLLLNKRCNMFAKTKSGECALDLAITGGRLDLFERFVDAGLSVKNLTLKTLRVLRKMTTDGNREALRFLQKIISLRNPTEWISPVEETGQLKKSLQEKDGTRPGGAAEIEIEELKALIGKLRTAVEVNKKRAKKSEIEYEELKALHAELKILAEEKDKEIDDQARKHTLKLGEINELYVERIAELNRAAQYARDDMETLREKNATLSDRFEETETKMRVLSEEKEIQAHNASRDIEDLTTEQAKLADRYERTVAELRAVTQEKEEIARQLEKAKEHAALLQIPSTDVRMTKIKLGEGAYGEVRVGYWRGSPVAVKKFFSCLETDYYIRLFEQEISICSRARHPNIVFMCGVTTENGTPLQIITELLEGSLSDVIKAALRSQCALSLREQIDLALGISAGVSYLHQLGPDGVLHGDIRSSNVVVTSLMEAKICDLGAAHFAEVSLSAGPLSPEYLAPERSPERRRGSLRNTKLADVYSMGVTLIELMTGQQPVASCRFQQASDVRHPLVKEIFLRMINVDPTFRPTAHECLALLEQVRQSDVYNRCPRKRMVRGKFHGESQVSLALGPWLQHYHNLQFIPS